jgi:hypothetical protein
MPNHREKHKKYNNVVFMLIHGGLIFKFNLRNEAKVKRRMITRENA